MAELLTNWLEKLPPDSIWQVVAAPIIGRLVAGLSTPTYYFLGF